MKRNHQARPRRNALCGALIAVLAIAAPYALASSHREAPAITKMPKLDGADLYAFRSYESGRSGYVTFIANYVPLQDAYGGPNYFTMERDGFYDIHLDTNADAGENLPFAFRFHSDSRDIRLNVGASTLP